MSNNALNGKIMKKVIFTIPINNAPDINIPDIVFGNSLDEVESTAVQMANDYARKNEGIKDPKKPVRFVIEAADGNPYLSWINGIFKLIQDKAEDKNDEAGTPDDVNQSKSNAATVGK